MKKISLIMLGIIIGLLISITFSRPNKNPVEPVEDSTQHSFIFGDLRVGAIENICMIESISNHMPIILIQLNEDGFISELRTFDNNLVNINFSDTDADGKWDHRSHINKEERFYFNSWKGFPDTAYIEGTNAFLRADPLIRIDGEYFQSIEVDGKYFIKKNNKNVELEEYKPNLYRIKKANQRVDPTVTTPVESGKD